MMWTATEYSQRIDEMEKNKPHFEDRDGSKSFEMWVSRGGNLDIRIVEGSHDVMYRLMSKDVPGLQAMLLAAYPPKESSDV